MLHQLLVEHRREMGNDVMVGTITLLHANSVPGLQKQPADLIAGPSALRWLVSGRLRLVDGPPCAYA